MLLVPVLLALPAVEAMSSPDLIVSLPPLMNCLPIALAQTWDLFAEQGIEVQIIGISDTQERSAALGTGHLDGMMCDVTRALLDIGAGLDLVITSAVDPPVQTGSATLAVVSPVGFDADSLDAAFEKGFRIATVFQSDLEYQLDTLLESLEFDRSPSATYAFWTDLLQIAIWFGAQSLPVAAFPEPYLTYLTTYAPVGGTALEVHELSTFDEIDVLPTVIVFRREVVEEVPEVLEAFYAAYRQSIERMNTVDRDELLDDAIDTALELFFPGSPREAIPEEVLLSIVIPIFQQPEVLDQEQYDSVAAWMVRRGYATETPAFEDAVTSRFVP
jgi:ABC-type nitrate/sulfonate/bicarbonate transport system substrate-binding protein